MPRNPLSSYEMQLLHAREKLKSLDRMKENQLRNTRATILKAFEAGMSQNAIARALNTNGTRVKVLISQALAERLSE